MAFINLVIFYNYLFKTLDEILQNNIILSE